MHRFHDSIVWCVCYYHPQSHIRTYHPLLFPSVGKVVASLLFNTGAGLGFNIISALELSGSGLQWTNAADPQSAEDPFNVAIIFGMFILDSILYFIIGWYVATYLANASSFGKYDVTSSLRQFHTFTIPLHNLISHSLLPLHTHSSYFTLTPPTSHPLLPLHTLTPTTCHPHSSHLTPSLLPLDTLTPST